MVVDEFCEQILGSDSKIAGAGVLGGFAGRGMGS